MRGTEEARHGGARLGVVRDDVEHRGALADNVDVQLEHEEGGGAVVVEGDALVDVSLGSEVQRLEREKG